MFLTTLTLAAVAAYIKANLPAIVVGFLGRHFSPQAVAAVEAVWAKIHALVTGAVAAVKAKL